MIFWLIFGGFFLSYAWVHLWCLPAIDYAIACDWSATRFISFAVGSVLGLMGVGALIALLVF